MFNQKHRTHRTLLLEMAKILLGLVFTLQCTRGIAYSWGKHCTITLHWWYIFFCSCIVNIIRILRDV